MLRGRGPGGRPDTVLQMADGTRRASPDRGSPPGPRPRLLVSACLLGDPCNYRGAASPRRAVADLGERFDLVPVCPEVAGGLPVPRPAAEIGPDGRVRTLDGHDVTAAFVTGAEAAVDLARATGASGAVLKARSPSCGCVEVYDGTFTGTLVPGEGFTAAALRRAGLPVVSEDDVADGVLPDGGLA